MYVCTVLMFLHVRCVYLHIIHVGGLALTHPLTATNVHIIFKASHQCYIRMTCSTPTPGHPSTADEAWYWQKCVLRTGWLSFLTSRPMQNIAVCSQESCGSLIKSCTCTFMAISSAYTTPYQVGIYYAIVHMHANISDWCCMLISHVPNKGLDLDT